MATVELSVREEKVNRNLYLVKQEYYHETFMVSLTDEQVRLLEWMIESDMISEDWDIQPIANVDFVKI